MITGRSSDTIDQHLHTAIFLGRFYRGILQDFINGNINFEQIFFPLNLGSDLTLTLSYYGLYDPLNFIYAFFPPNHVNAAFTASYLLHIYIAGLSFLALTLYLKHNWYWSSIGAVAYVTSAYLIYTGSYHPFFISGPMILPLLILGVKLILDQKKYGVLLLAIFVCISLISGLYFAVMNFFGCLFFYLISIISNRNYRNINYIRNTFVRSLNAHILGLGLSAIAVIPTVYAFLLSSRVGGSRHDGTIPLFTPADTLIATFGAFVTPFPNGDIDLGSVGVQALVVLLAFSSIFVLKPRRRLFWTIVWVSALIFLIFPIFSIILNLGSYASYRWVYIISLALCAAFVEVTSSRLLTLHKAAVFGLIILSGLFTIYYLPNLSQELRHKLIAGGIIFGSAITLWVLHKYQNSKAGNIVAVYTGIFICFCSLLTSIMLTTPQAQYTAEVLFNPKEGIPEKTYEAIYGYKFLDNLEPAERIDTNRKPANLAMSTNIPTVTGFYSLMNKNIVEYHRFVGNANLTHNDRIIGVDGRPYADALLSIKYSLCEDPQKNKFTANPEDDERYSGQYENGVCNNRYYEPFGLFYDSVFNTSELDRYSYPDRERLLMSTAVIDDASKLDLPKYEAKNQPTPVSILQPDSIKVHPGYLELNFNHPLKANKFYYLLATKVHDYSENTTISMHDTVWNRYYWIPMSNNNYFSGNHDLLANLGARNFTRSGFSFDIDGYDTTLASKLEFKLYEIDTSDLPNLIKERQSASTGTPASFKTNEIEQEINAPSPGVYVATVEYSPGWSATVDGRPVPVFKAQVGFVGIEVSSGVHKIVLSYQTPGLRYGFAVSLLTAFGILSFYGLKSLRKRFLKKNK